MTQTPKTKSEEVIKEKIPEQGNGWEEDQREHSYYYDDSHGYIKYEPEEDDESETNQLSRHPAG